jgi:signal transduction histidine kinase
MPIMNAFHRESLSRRQALWVVIVALVAGLLLSVVIVLRDYWETRQSIAASASQILKSVEATATQAAYTLDQDLAGDVLAGLLQFEAVTLARLTSESGQLLAVRERATTVRPRWETALFGENQVFAMPLVQGDARKGFNQEVGRLEITVYGGSAARAYFERVGTEAVMGLLRTGLLAWLMLWVSQRLVTGPLQNVAQSIAVKAVVVSKILPTLEMPISHERDEIGVLVTRINELLQDVNRHVQDREAYIASLARANAELSRLGEVMAHHFQEPTRRLASFTQRLLNHSALASDEDSRQSLNFINAESKRLSALVGDAQRYLALDHTQVGAGGTADSAAALRQSIAAVGAASADADIVVREPLPRVRLAEKTLRELFAVLLDNALRYRHPQRPLHIEVSATIDGDRAVFRFADNGSGIAPEYREQVLGLFTRLVPSSIPGTGMGLALAYKMTGLAGGHFRIEDGLDGGTGVVFDLPIETP